MDQDRGAYYRRRQKEELEAAARAASPIAAEIHRSLAARYLVLTGEGHVRPLNEPTI